MKKLFACLTLLFVSLTAYSAGTGPFPSLTVGGRVFTDTANLIILYCFPQTTNTNCTFRKANAGAGYQPSGSKAFYAYAWKTINANSSPAGFFLLTSTNDVNVSSATAFTGATYLFSTSAVPAIYSTLSTGAISEGPLDVVVANGKYVSTQMSGTAGTATVQLFGYEK